jgi:hypothetical protein
MRKEIKKTKNLEFKTGYYDIKNDITNGEINIRIGGRGLGKTFSAYRYIIDRYLTTGEKFIIMRRQQTTADSLLSDIVNYYNFKMYYEHDAVSGINTIFINDKECGFLLSLSCTTKYKSHYFHVQNIIFDEFIKSATEKRISEDECFTFFEFMETVVRDRTDVTVCLLSNAVKLGNDYFRMWGIMANEIEMNTQIQINDVVNLKMLVSTNEYMERKAKTLTFKASQGTKYFDYAFNNLFDTGNLKYYIKENNSRLLPSKDDFYFSYQNTCYHVNDKYISMIDFSNIPLKATIISDTAEHVRNSNLIDSRVEFVALLQDKLYNKVIFNKLYFSDLNVAVNLSPILFFKYF